MATAGAAPAGELTATDAEDANAVDAIDAIDLEVPAIATPTFWAVARWGKIVGLGIVGVLIALAALVGWMSYRAHQTSADDRQRDLFLQVGRQSAVNLTTIDWQHADRDVDRILDTATGSFHDDFASQAKPFIDVVQQSKSTTVGTVTEAGVESETGDSAQVLVAVTVKTSNAAAPEQEPRSWRLRVGLQKTGADVKVSDVGFVP